MSIIVEALVGLGFKDATVVKELATTETVRIWTDKGWAYQRWAASVSAETVALWAKDKVPGK